MVNLRPSKLSPTVYGPLQKHRALAQQGLHGNLAGKLGHSWVSVATTGRSQETAAQEGRLAFRPERTHWAEEAPDILSSFPNPCWPVLLPIPLASPSAPPPHLRTNGLFIVTFSLSSGLWILLSLLS